MTATLDHGRIRQGFGDHLVAWLTAGALCLVAAGLCLAIPRPVPEPR